MITAIKSSCVPLCCFNNRARAGELVQNNRARAEELVQNKSAHEQPNCLNDEEAFIPFNAMLGQQSKQSRAI